MRPGAYRSRAGEEEAARHRGAIMAEQRKRLASPRRDWRTSWAVTSGRVSKIEHGAVSTDEGLASYIAALSGKLELVADIGGHLLKMLANQAA